MEAAGDDIINEYCAQYETSTKSYLLPTLIDSEYPEGRDPVANSIPKRSRILTQREEDRHKGIVTDQTGEICEYRVYCEFHQLVHTKTNDPFIVLRKVDLDNNNDKSLKEMALRNELPTIDLSAVNMKKEHDFLIIIKHVGIIVVEVKSTSIGITSAENQLSSGICLMHAIMGGVRGKGKSLVPVEKMMIFPNEVTPSPPTATHFSSHQIHQDKLSSFSSIFDDVVIKLKSSSGYSFSSADFDRFTRILVGLWCMSPLRQGFVLDKTLASTVPLLKHIDQKVDNQVISSYHEKYQSKKNKGKYQRPVTDVVYCSPNDVYRKSEDIKVIYLTMQQKHILDNEPRALIVGASGTGKTLLVLFKCIEIIENDANAKILLVAPTPHDLRCQKILLSNKLAAHVITRFPPDDINIASVFIISLDGFLKVKNSELLSYDLSPYHVFMDDVQMFDVVDKFIATFDEIAMVINLYYIKAIKHHKYFWCCLDVLQGPSCNRNGKGNSHLLLFETDGTPRPFDIPLIELNKILRNSSDIISVVTKLREDAITRFIKSNGFSPNAKFSAVSSGHNITGAPVLYHKLDKLNENENQFVLQMIDDELKILLKGKLAYNPSDIAILYYMRPNSSLRINNLKQSISTYLHQNYSVAVQDISSSIANSQTNHIVFGDIKHTMSYEVPCVIYVHISDTGMGSSNPLYVLTSRARARLTIIDCHKTEPPFVGEQVTLLTWREQNGTFVTKV